MPRSPYILSEELRFALRYKLATLSTAPQLLKHLKRFYVDICGRCGDRSSSWTGLAPDRQVLISRARRKYFYSITGQNTYLNLIEQRLLAMPDVGHCWECGTKRLTGEDLPSLRTLERFIAEERAAGTKVGPSAWVRRKASPLDPDLIALFRSEAAAGLSVVALRSLARSAFPDKPVPGASRLSLWRKAEQGRAELKARRDRQWEQQKIEEYRKREPKGRLAR